ncbi:hypothetical protein LPB140_01250 [Sphingorhabdus lutea]|uniref:Sulfate exporter family transporter n=1 Tax=Sphingorhabdus lutea TaxID=1913578 RepID=A0A1L3J988_9SPHN|nr:putative sulfate exporter family transporter [Sphingorhabdus lutea]APG61687.1 hypothetical protein LPB140_01250 [Sphingorhabdus lutea]
MIDKWKKSRKLAEQSQFAGDLYGEVYLSSEEQAVKPERKPLFHGLSIVVMASLAAAWLSEHYGMPIILLGLLIGLALNFLSTDERTHAGLDYASRNFLRFGIVLLGLQVTFLKIGSLGGLTFIALIIVMSAAIAGSFLAARFSAQSNAAAILAGGATAICGASAALAIYSVVGKERVSQAQFALILVGISLFSALAMTLYPMAADLLHLTDRQAGFLTGAAIHDVAQSLGAGFAVSDAAGGYATIVKLARVAMLAPIVAIISMFISSNDENEQSKPIWKKLALPWFITAFLGVLTLNSLVEMPVYVGEYGLSISKALLLLAVTATAMRSRMDLVLQMGWRSLMPVMAATIASFVAAIIFTLTIL